MEYSEIRAQENPYTKSRLEKADLDAKANKLFKGYFQWILVGLILAGLIVLLFVFNII